MLWWCIKIRGREYVPVYRVVLDRGYAVCWI